MLVKGVLGWNRIISARQLVFMNNDMQITVPYSRYPVYFLGLARRNIRAKKCIRKLYFISGKVYSQI